MHLPPRRIIVAPDSFKGSLTAACAAAAMARGVRRVLPDAEITLIPVSDGGEGLVDVLTPLLGGMIQTTSVQGPLPGKRVDARWGFADRTATAIIEMAQAAGLALVPLARRNPRLTTTYGVGELILAALDRRARLIIVGIGGSATNDGGAGMASALGAEFFNEHGAVLPPGGAALAKLARISTERLDMRLRSVQVTVACDVTSPLTGPTGASQMFSPQKGADPYTAMLLDAALRRYAEILRTQLGRDVETIPGSGAAGGLGAGLLAFCDADLKSGIDLVLDAAEFDKYIAGADLVLTGEGKIDAQTRAGKAVAGILARAREAGVPVAAVAGMVEGNSADLIVREGFLDLITLAAHESESARAMKEAEQLVEERTTDLIRRIMEKSR